MLGAVEGKASESEQVSKVQFEGDRIRNIHDPAFQRIGLGQLLSQREGLGHHQVALAVKALLAWILDLGEGHIDRLGIIVPPTGQVGRINGI